MLWAKAVGQVQGVYHDFDGFDEPHDGACARLVFYRFSHPILPCHPLGHRLLHLQSANITGEQPSFWVFFFDESTYESCVGRRKVCSPGDASASLMALSAEQERPYGARSHSPGAAWGIVCVVVVFYLLQPSRGFVGLHHQSSLRGAAIVVGKGGQMLGAPGGVQGLS